MQYNTKQHIFTVCFADPHGSSPQVDIAPLLGRLVIFRSREVWHGIQPSATARRWAVTLWVLAEDGPE